VILQKSGLNPAHFDGMGSNTRNPLLQPSYVDPNTIFGPSLALLNQSVPQIESRNFNQQVSHTPNLNPAIGGYSFQSLPVTCLPPISNQIPPLTQNAQIIPPNNQLMELPPLPLKKKGDFCDANDLNDFFQKRVSNTSTACSEEDEMEKMVLMMEKKKKIEKKENNENMETGKKKILYEKEIHIKNPGTAMQKARKRTKVICGHPWKNHHAKGLCKNCYETYGKTRRPWKCSHGAHFAKGYCKKCYLKLRQKVSVNEICPFGINETQMNGGFANELFKTEMKMHEDFTKAEFEYEKTQMKEEMN